MKTFIVVVLFTVTVLILLAMLNVIEMSKDNPEDFRKRFQEYLDAAYVRSGGAMDYHLIVVKWISVICIIIIILCILALIF